MPPADLPLVGTVMAGRLVLPDGLHHQLKARVLHIPAVRVRILFADRTDEIRV